MTPGGYRAENHDHLDQLTEVDDHGRRVGRDPGAISLAVLTAAGHPRSNAKSVINRMREASEARDDVAQKWVLFSLTEARRRAADDR